MGQGKSCAVTGTNTKELTPPLVLNWRKGREMPFKMDQVQSVIIGNTVYVGGGTSEVENMNLVVKYDSKRNRWSTLPKCNVIFFAMTSISGQLALVGGAEPVNWQPMNHISVFDSNKWIESYPPMTNASSSLSAVSHENYVIVIHSRTAEEPNKSLVEVLNVTTKTWCMADPLPNILSEAKQAVIASTLYLLGGRDADNETKTVYTVDLGELVSKAMSKTTDDQDKPSSICWKTIEDTPFVRSGAVSVGTSLLALGGQGEIGVKSKAVYLYQPDSKTWVHVGDLPTTRWGCTCSVLPSGEVLVAGGCEDYLEESDSADLLRFV